MMMAAQGRQLRPPLRAALHCLRRSFILQPHQTLTVHKPQTLDPGGKPSGTTLSYPSPAPPAEPSSAEAARWRAAIGSSHSAARPQPHHTHAASALLGSPHHRISTARMRSLPSQADEDASALGSCWSCGRERDKTTPFFCAGCGSILPVDSEIDFFDVLAINRSFRLDLGQLEGKYKALQKRLHPDLFGMKREEERRHSAEQSARVIEAYYTLLRPLSRARYLLRLEGREVGEEATLHDQSLLMEIMEIREAIDGADEVVLRQLMEQNKWRLADCEAKLAEAFDARDLDAAVRHVQLLSYLLRIDQEISDRSP